MTPWRIIAIFILFHFFRGGGYFQFISCFLLYQNVSNYIYIFIVFVCDRTTNQISFPIEMNVFLKSGNALSWVLIQSALLKRIDLCQ